MESNNFWLVNVPVATLWTSYDSSREIDEAAVSGNVNLEEWLEKLTYELRLQLCDDNLVQSQVLFGQEVLIIDEKDDWVHVVIPDQPSGKDKRGYPGWIPKDQLIQQSDWYIKKGQFAVVTSRKALLYSEQNEKLMELSYQTMLPVVEDVVDRIRVKTPTGIGILRTEDVEVHPSEKEIPQKNGDAIVAAGEQFLGLPYLWGGMSSYGYDCSGFSYSMCRANGCIIPRDAHEQAAAGMNIDIQDILPGDLLFFAYEEGKGQIHHVGIYYGDGKLLHSPNTGKNIEIIPLEGTIYEKELCAARRYWKNTEA
ncbi:MULTISPECIES: C40 family peptidase [unclassified Mesobacillus]|jgi:gamma-D-glutamyl-L-lysine dipeptidyl-peptidase|uniref:C40 family peptidase n=1 Tax=unclassified Mesobacillus TaxID=2675270 RepID=UPI0020415A98|nr:MULTISPECIES: C40 family peptidase [unclassified Mesobacillus]MCM3121700.1 C40 family peptidase [Mesobacillus sp. MER 33]MCM3231664.1 C40 family peptidase [Mesobacillus sp. MER 48]